MLEDPGTRQPLSFDARVDDLGIGLAGVPGDVHFELVLEALEGTVLVRGSIAGVYVGQCRRCLTAIETPFDFKVAEVYRPPGGEWEEGYVITQATIDLERVLRDTVGLEMPINPLCRPDCAGLCPTCGADRNTDPCGCPAGGGDLRWAALKDLTDPSR